MFSNSFQFWSYLIVLIPAIAFSIFVLYSLLVDQHRTRSIHNHIVILLVIIGFFYQITVYPWKLHFFRVSTDLVPNVSFCYLWYFLEWFFPNTQTLLLTWSSIERYFLIFHNQLLSTRIKRILLHYFPMLIIPLYTLIYTIIVLLFPSCNNWIDLTQIPCLYPCMLDFHSIIIYEAMMHTILPVFTIAIINIYLCGHFIWRRNCVHRPNRWRQHRKLILQMLILPSVCLLFGIPFAIVIFLRIWITNAFVLLDTLLYASYFCYYPSLMLPMLAAWTSPEVKRRFRRIWRIIKHKNTRIVPQQHIRHRKVM